MQQLLDKIVLWTNLEDPARVAGHGVIIAINGSFILVDVIRESEDDNEPPFQRVFDLSDQTLMFFNDISEHTAWMTWLHNMQAAVRKEDR